MSSITLTCAQSGTSYTTNLNNALASIDTGHVGITAPTSEVVQGKFWLDISAADMVLKIYSGSAWLPMLNLDGGVMKAENSLLADALSTARTVTLAGDASGSFAYNGSANSTLTVSNSKAAKLTTTRAISLSGDATGTVNFDGSAAVTIPVTIANAGKVLQIVSGSSSALASTTSNSHVVGPSGLAVTITPTSTSSKILVLLNGGSAQASGAYMHSTIYRDAFNLAVGSSGSDALEYFSTGTNAPHSTSHLDAPNTTAAITYRPYFRTATSGQTAWFSRNSNLIQMIVMEIGA